MSCGVNIPLSSVVEAIVNDYADVFVGEILKRVSLNNSTIDNGTFTDVTIRGDLTLDDTAKGALCSALQDCIATKIQDELGCERDNHVTDFAIDKTNDRITITLKFGEKFHISRAELAAWIGGNGGGIKSGTLIIDGDTQTIRVTNNDNSIVDIDVSELKDQNTFVRSGSVVGTQLNLVRTDGQTVSIDVSELKDQNTFVRSGSVVGTQLNLVRTDGQTVSIDMSGFSTADNDTLVTGGSLTGHTLTLTLSNGGQVEIDLSGLSVGKDSPYIVSGVFVERNGGYWLDFTRNDGTHVNVGMTDIINKIIQTVFDMVMRMGYRINTQADDYTLTGDDFNGRTIVRADKDGDQTITIPKPTSEDFVGKAIIVRKTNGTVGTFVNLVAGSDVSLLPEDATPVRRVGSSVTLVYVGNGVYDVFGELP